MRRLLLILALSTLGSLVAVPAPALAAGSIGALTINPDSVRGGASTTGTVSLAFADPSPTVVRLFSSDPAAAQMPTSFTIPAGQTTGTFTVTSSAAAPPTIVQVTAATPDNGLRQYNISVNAATPAGPSLSSISFVPTSIVRGTNATGTVRFTAPMTDGAVVQLASSQPAVARVPQETVVNANTSTSTFNLSTSSVTAATTVTITATWFDVTRTATITVKPGTPPAADVV